MTSETATIAILKDLVAFDTTSRLSNMPLLEYSIEILRRNGIEPQLIWNEDRTKANLWATIGPGQPGGIILPGHPIRFLSTARNGHPILSAWSSAAAVTSRVAHAI